MDRFRLNSGVGAGRHWWKDVGRTAWALVAKEGGGRRISRSADSSAEAEEIGHPGLGHGERCGGGGPA